MTKQFDAKRLKQLYNCNKPFIRTLRSNHINYLLLFGIYKYENIQLTRRTSEAVWFLFVNFVCNK